VRQADELITATEEECIGTNHEAVCLPASGHAAALPTRVMKSRRFTGPGTVLRSKEQTYCGCDVDCHATNFHPSGVFVHTLRNLSRRLRGWPLISASIAAPPQDDRATPIETYDVKRILADIDTDHGDSSIELG
jgi:hypothetical protein